MAKCQSKMMIAIWKHLFNSNLSVSSFPLSLFPLIHLFLPLYSHTIIILLPSFPFSLSPLPVTFLPPPPPLPPSLSSSSFPLSSPSSSPPAHRLGYYMILMVTQKMENWSSEKEISLLY